MESSWSCLFPSSLGVVWDSGSSVSTQSIIICSCMSVSLSRAGGMLESKTWVLFLPRTQEGSVLDTDPPNSVCLRKCRYMG